MNALIVRTLPEGMDVSLQTDPSDFRAKLLAEYLYELILKWEAEHIEVEVAK